MRKTGRSNQSERGDKNYEDIEQESLGYSVVDMDSVAEEDSVEDVDTEENVTRIADQARVERETNTVTLPLRRRSDDVAKSRSSRRGRSNRLSNKSDARRSRLSSNSQTEAVREARGSENIDEEQAQGTRQTNETSDNRKLVQTMSGPEYVGATSEVGRAFGLRRNWGTENAVMDEIRQRREQEEQRRAQEELQRKRAINAEKYRIERKYQRNAADVESGSSADVDLDQIKRNREILRIKRTLRILFLIGWLGGIGVIIAIFETIDI